MMYKCLPITDIYAREIIDSRGNPTVEVEVLAGEAYIGRAAVPSGASTGKYEAVELRDGEKRYNGLGVQQAVANVNEKIAENLIGINVFEQAKIDQLLMDLDRTENKSGLGANAMLGVSLAAAKAAAEALQIPLYSYLGGTNAKKMPVPMMNILNGGAHADNTLDIQEFMIMPVGACCFREGLRMCVEIYHELKKLLKEEQLATGVGDEGGFAPDLSGEEEALDIIVKAIENAGYKANEDFKISLDVAASEWKTNQVGEYLMPKKNKQMNTDELIEMWEEISDKYPIFSIEDPLDEEDWKGWEKITEKLGDKIRLVGDDLFVTNVKRLKRGLKNKCANAILIKPNQIGTVTETINAVKMAQNMGYIAIMSHRSGESEDTTIADLAVGLNTGYIKTGAPCRGERTAKYNRLLRIEEQMGI